MAASGGYYLSSRGQRDLRGADEHRRIDRRRRRQGRRAATRSRRSASTPRRSRPSAEPGGGDARGVRVAARRLGRRDQGARARVDDRRSTICSSRASPKGGATTPDKIAPFAEGRIFSGAQAQGARARRRARRVARGDREGAQLGELAGRREGGVVARRSGLLETLDTGGRGRRQSRAPGAVGAPMRVGGVARRAPRSARSRPTWSPFVDEPRPLAVRRAGAVACPVPYALTSSLSAVS